MATMNVSLPQKMKDWVEKRTSEGQFANSSDYIRDLVRRDIERTEGIGRLQAEIDKGRAGPFTEYGSSEELLKDIRRRTASRLKKTDAA